ncbi:hypothetical protein [Nocardioides panzhihuensis]|uniref:Uncharacterized membrane protein HdeD (DUF308 family) n=1 Tax=Nocardioides panzhihuensis TaxID=860243 RepID=A0A7Z0IUW0_9ACTN|nr:hypothetical protein [Nocardioides panzhihuensis]NYI80406.1 uncharacterized membrane protein HdeD (DUF308 family) [Nocardioides panzhihuensis]
MSTSVETGRPGTPSTATGSLPKLYVARFGFAIGWAVLVALTASTLDAPTIALLVIYPLFDVAAAVVDFRTSGASGPRTLLYVNMALSLLTAVGVAVAATSGIPGVLQVWGVWAITAGLVQLIVAVRRYRLGGQWAMILSGGISTFAGTGFILMAAGPNASLTSLAGYATLGGIFFLVSALRLRQRASKVD